MTKPMRIINPADTDSFENARLTRFHHHQAIIYRCTFLSPSLERWNEMKSRWAIGDRVEFQLRADNAATGGID